MDFLNHHSKGYEKISHKEKVITTSNTSQIFEDYLFRLKSSKFKVAYIPAGYEHRADLISDLFYDTPIYDWLLLYFNDIKDPFNELNVGDRILIPEI